MEVTVKRQRVKQSMSQARLVGTVGPEPWVPTRRTVRLWPHTTPLDLMAGAGLMAMVTGESPPEGQ